MNKPRDKELLKDIREEVLASYEPHEVKGVSFEDFFNQVDIQHGYEESWDAKFYKPYYFVVFNQIQKELR